MVRSKYRCWGGRLLLSAVLTAALVAGEISAAGGVRAAAGPAAQAQGRFLSGSVLGVDLATRIHMAPASASAPPSATSDNHVNLGGGIKRLGNNPGGILTLGAVNQYATASADGSSFASSGAVGSNGAIAIGANGNADTGIAPSTATLDLASIIAAAPTLQSGLSSASVNVGALAATANETGAGVQSGAYRIGSLNLDLTSPTLLPVYASASSALDAALVAVRTLGVITNLPNASSLLAPLTMITSADGSFLINLQTGVVHVDVAKLLTGQQINGQPGDINNLPPNTLLLPYVTAGLTTQLLPAITTAITGPTGLVQNLTTQLGAATLAGLPIPLASLNPILTTLTSTLNPIVAGLGISVVTPVANSLAGLVALTGNVEPTRPNTVASYSKAALSIGVVPTPQATSSTLATATVGPNAGPPVIPTATDLTPASGPIAGNTTVTVTGTGFVPASPR